MQRSAIAPDKLKPAAVQQQPGSCCAAIGRVTHYRQSSGCQMDPNLVGPAGQGPSLDQRPATSGRQAAQQGAGRPSLGQDPVARGTHLADGPVGAPLFCRRRTGHQGQITFLYGSLLKQLRKIGRGLPLFRKQHQSGSTAVKAMDDPHRFPDPLTCELLRHPVFQGALQLIRCPLAGHAGRLVDRQQITVLIDNRLRPPATAL